MIKLEKPIKRMTTKNAIERLDQFFQFEEDSCDYAAWKLVRRIANDYLKQKNKRKI